APCRALESWPPGGVEPFENPPPPARRAAAPPPPRRKLRKPVAIERDAARREAHLIHVGLHAGIAQHPPQHAQRLAQRVPGLLLVAVAPQQPDEVLPGAALARAAREVDEQRQVLAPQEF